MVKAIIFDCFGVLTEGPLESFIFKYVHSDSNKLAQISFLEKQVNSHDIAWEDFVHGVAEIAGTTYEQTQQHLDADDNQRANTVLFDYIEQKLKSRYRIGLLSNAAANWLEGLFTKDQLALFDDFVLSFEHGVAKPEAVIYEIVADRLSVRLDECVFVDDREDYCQGARGVGMQAIQYKDFAQLTRELEAVLANSQN